MEEFKTNNMYQFQYAHQHWSIQVPKMLSYMFIDNDIIFLSWCKKRYQLCCWSLFLGCQPNEYTLTCIDELPFRESSIARRAISSFFQNRLTITLWPFVTLELILAVDCFLVSCLPVVASVSWFQNHYHLLIYQSSYPCQ